MEQKVKCLEEANRALKESNEKLYNSMQAFQIAAEESGSLVFTYDTNEQKILVDEKTAQAFHVEPIQTGVPYEMVNRGIIAQESVKEYIRIHEAMLHGEKEAGGIVKLIPADGRETIYDLKFRMIMNEDGRPSGTAVGVYRDITERYVKDMANERYQQIVFSSERYTYEYEVDKDLLSIYPSLAESGGDVYKRQVRNNSAYSSVEVSMTSFVRQAGSTSEVTLAKWDATRLTQHQVAMQIQPTGNSITKFPAQDVTTIRTSPVDMGMIGPESATEYIFDGQFENSLVRTHKGEEVVFDTVFLVSKAGA